MVLLYMVTWIPSIYPFMLAYIAYIGRHTWILWDRKILRGIQNRTNHSEHFRIDVIEHHRTIQNGEQTLESQSVTLQMTIQDKGTRDTHRYTIHRTNPANPFENLWEKTVKSRNTCLVHLFFRGHSDIWNSIFAGVFRRCEWESNRVESGWAVLSSKRSCFSKTMLGWGCHVPGHGFSMFICLKVCKIWPVWHDSLSGTW